MNTLWRVPAFAWLAFSSSAWAQCSLVLGAGHSTVTGINTARYEGRLFAESSISGAYYADGTSHTTRFGITCPMSRSFEVSLDYREGFRAFVASDGTLRLDDVQANFAVKRFAEVRGYGLSVLGKYPVTEQLSVTGRVGALVGVGFVGLSSGNISLAEKKRGYLPLMAVGLRYDGGRNWYLQYEESRYTDGSRFRERYLGIGYRF